MLDDYGLMDWVIVEMLALEQHYSFFLASSFDSYHFFQNSIWKLVRIAKTSDCKISWRVFSQGTVNSKINIVNIPFHLFQI